MTVLHVSGAKGWGGNEQQIINLIPELNILGVENIIFGVQNSLLKKKCDENNLVFIAAKRHKLNLFANYRYLKTLVNQLKPDLIHLHTSDSLTVFVLSDLLFKLKTKTIFSRKGISAHSSFLSNLKYNYAGVNSIFCVSQNVEENFQSILKIKNRVKTTVLPDCVSLGILNSDKNLNLRSKYSVKENYAVIGNIANHTRAKDLFTFIYTVDHLVNVMGKKDLVFFQIGEFTKLTPSLLKIVKERKLEDFIIFTDKIENAFCLNRQFDLFLLTSEREGGPTSILEAMLMETPIITTNVGIVKDVIEDGVNGFISAVKDYKGLAEKVFLLLKDKNLQNQFAAKSKFIIKNEFVASKIAQRTFKEYQNIINID